MESMTVIDNQTDEFKQFSKNVVSALLHQTKHINFCMLCTTDGFEITTASKKNWSNTGKIAAVSSSIMALISAFISEIHLVNCQTITLDTETGKAFLSIVPHDKFPSVLVVITDKNVLLGEILHELKKVIAHLHQY